MKDLARKAFNKGGHAGFIRRYFERIISPTCRQARRDCADQRWLPGSRLGDITHDMQDLRTVGVSLQRSKCSFRNVNTPRQGLKRAEAASNWRLIVPVIPRPARMRRLPVEVADG
jgi:hypothetical protein